jgi:hypothetical protein
MQHADVTAIEAIMGFEKVKVTIKDLEECLAYVVSNHSR